MRTKPYVAIHRAKCDRCGSSAEYEWSGVCAERGPDEETVYYALCGPCDRELNRMTMTWMHGPQKADKIMKGY